MFFQFVESEWRSDVLFFSLFDTYLASVFKIFQKLSWSRSTEMSSYILHIPIKFDLFYSDYSRL